MYVGGNTVFQIYTYFNNNKTAEINVEVLYEFLVWKLLTSDSKYPASTHHPSMDMLDVPTCITYVHSSKHIRTVEFMNK